MIRSTRRMTIRLSLLLALFSGAVYPTVAAAQVDRDLEEVETIEEIEEVAPVNVNTEDGVPGALRLVGRIHPLLVHFPIAWMLLLLLVDALAFGFNREALRTVGLPLLGITLVSFLPALATGLLNAGHKDPATTHMLLHRNAAFAATGLAALAFGVRWSRRSTGLRGKALAAYFALVALSVAVLSFAGHLGGKMVFGEEYLPF